MNYFPLMLPLVWSLALLMSFRMGVAEGKELSLTKRRKARQKRLKELSPFNEIDQKAENKELTKNSLWQEADEAIFHQSVDLKELSIHPAEEALSSSKREDLGQLRLQQILNNIEHYNGTELGQQEVL